MNDSTYMFSIILNIRCVHLSFNPTRFTPVYISFVKAQSFARDPAHFLVYGLKCCESFISDQAYHTCKVYLPTFGIFLYFLWFSFSVNIQSSSHGSVNVKPSDPGNLKYMRDGRICFLDFGLMDRVPARIMEGFADGIRSVVSQNWTALAHSMQVVECVPDPVKRDLKVEGEGNSTFLLFNITDDILMKTDDIHIYHLKIDGLV